MAYWLHSGNAISRRRTRRQESNIQLSTTDQRDRVQPRLPALLHADAVGIRTIIRGSGVRVARGARLPGNAGGNGGEQRSRTQIRAALNEAIWESNQSTTKARRHQGLDLALCLGALVVTNAG